MVMGHCFRLVRKDTGAVVAIIVKASAVVATIAWTNATVVQGGTNNLHGFQAHNPPTYMGRGHSMASTTLAITRGVDDTRSIRDIGVSTTKEENQSSSNSRRKRKTSIPWGFQGWGNDYQGQGRVRASNQTRQMTCYHYHQPEHMRRDCPQRLGSRNYGTA